MSSALKALALFVLFAILVIFSFLTGELIGMKSGHAYTNKMTAPMDAAYVVSVISLLENNMEEEAREMLETKLDNYIINYWTARQCKLIGLNPFLKEQNRKEMFYSAIAHRKSNPSEHAFVHEYLGNIEKDLHSQRPPRGITP